MRGHVSKIQKVTLPPTDSISRSGQLHNITAKMMTESGSYSKPVFAFQYRLGCDNRPGSMAKIDKCGKCGGNGVCPLPCDGVKGSSKLVDN